MQHGPLFFDGHSRRAEEQWAFHEKYHDRMARLTGGGVGGREDVRGDSREPRPAPDYWVNYARKLEDMGLPRGDGNAVLHGSADARTRSPQLPPCGNYVSPPDRHYASRHWEPTSVTKSPVHMSREENVLHRLDWFAQKSEPDAADVIDLLREAEDVLARQESRRRDEAAHPAEYSQPPARISSSNLLPTHHGRDRGRPMGVPNSAPPHAVSSNGDVNITGGAGRYRTAPSSPPPATTPTVPPFQSMSQSAQPGQPSAGINWSQMSWCQQMEWYRTYYAWMMYYAQYYGAFLASKQLQQEHEKHHHYNHQKQKERSSRKKMNKEKTGLEELSREYRELATEVERLGQSIGNHGVTAKHVHPHSSRYMAGDDEYTLYRSDNCHSSLLRGPNPFSVSRDGGPAVSMSRPGLRVPVRQDYLNVKDEFAQEAHASNTSQDSKVLHSGQSHRPWLSQRCPSPEEDHKAGGAFKRPIHRDISRPYKYEARGDTGEKSQTDTEGGRNWDYDDSDRRRLDVPLNERGRMPSRLQRQQHVQEQEHVHPKEPRLSIYERKRRELEREKPRWCF